MPGLVTLLPLAQRASLCDTENASSGLIVPNTLYTYVHRAQWHGAYYSSPTTELYQLGSQHHPALISLVVVGSTS